MTSCLPEGRHSRLAYCRRSPIFETGCRRAIAEVLRAAEEPQCYYGGSSSSKSHSTGKTADGFAPNCLITRRRVDRQESAEAAIVSACSKSTDANHDSCGTIPLPSLSVPVNLPRPTFVSSDCDASEPLSPVRVAEATTVSAAAKTCPPRPPQPLAFSAAFECGNLLSAKLVSFQEAGGGSLPHVEYELEMESDTRSKQTQWFYFSCTNTIRCNVTFHIVNFTKKRSLYSMGMQPHVYSTQMGGSAWDATLCSDVQYAPNGRWSGMGTQFYSLSFRFVFNTADDVVYFATHTPYTYTMLRTFIGSLTRHPATAPYVCEGVLCRSLAGLPVPILLVTGGLPSVCTGPYNSNDCAARERNLAAARKKPVVVVIARQHPGEVVGSYVVAGLIRFLAGPSPEAAVLRERFCFHVIPMVNVDGVVFGNARCTLAGVDPNRVWHAPDSSRHPEIYALREYISQAQRRSEVNLFLDLHGHSQRPAAFFYGCCPEQVRSALLPKLVSLATKDVDFNGSRWRFAKEHCQTARAIMFSHGGIFNSYTLETSLFAQRKPACKKEPASPKAMQAALRDVLFLPTRVESIGSALGRAMVSFFQLEGKLPLTVMQVQHSLSNFSSFEIFDGSEEGQMPWLTYEALRDVSAEHVLAELETLGSTCFDLSSCAGGDEAPASDSDGDGAGPEEAGGCEYVQEQNTEEAEAPPCPRVHLAPRRSIRAPGLGGSGLTMSSPDIGRLFLRQEVPKAYVMDCFRSGTNFKLEAAPLSRLAIVHQSNASSDASPGGSSTGGSSPGRPRAWATGKEAGPVCSQWHAALQRSRLSKDIELDSGDVNVAPCLDAQRPKTRKARICQQEANALPFAAQAPLPKQLPPLHGGVSRGRRRSSGSFA